MQHIYGKKKPQELKMRGRKTDIRENEQTEQTEQSRGEVRKGTKKISERRVKHGRQNR